MGKELSEDMSLKLHHHEIKQLAHGKMENHRPERMPVFGLRVGCVEVGSLLM